MEVGAKLSGHLDRKIFVAGHNGMVGSEILRQLIKQGFRNIVTASRVNLDLTNQDAVNRFFEIEKPEQVYLAAAKVGGINANNIFPAEFIYQNLMIEANVIHAAYINKVQKLLFLGSSCIYPRNATQPMLESSLLSGKLEPTNEAYAIAKIAGIKLCESYNRQYGCDFRSVMPTNLYGFGDNYHLENSHVIPALIRKFHLAKLALNKDINAISKDEQVYGKIPDAVLKMLGMDSVQAIVSPLVKSEDVKVTLWGSGSPYREFLHVSDMASASIFVMDLEKDKYMACTEPMQSHINVGYSSDVMIKDLAKMVSDVVGYNGIVEFDTSKPDGPPKKLMDSSLLRNMGWKPSVDLTDGLAVTYKNYLDKLN